MTATASGNSSAAAVLKPVKPSIATTSTASRQDSGRSVSQVLNACFERPSIMSSNRAGPVPSRIAGEIDDHGDVLVAAAGVSPDVLVDPDHGHAVEPAGVIDQHAFALGKDRVVGGVPRDPETLGDPGNGQVLDHDGLPAPTAARAATASPAARPRGWCLGATRAHTRCTGSGAPSPAASWDASPAARAPAAGPRCREPRLRSRTGDTTWSGIDDPARQHRPVGLKPLPDDLEAELVEAAERGQVRAGEGSVRHVEVFRMGGVGTSIIGRPRPLPGHRRADPPLHPQLRRARLTCVGVGWKQPLLLSPPR